MLANDSTFDNQNIYVYHYPSRSLGKSFSVDEVADNMRLMLTSDGVLRHDHIIFLSHSLGGVVTRAFIVKYRERLIGKIPMLYFFATPTTGSPYATLASLVSRNPQLRQLYPMQSDGFLASLQSQWLDAGLRLKSYCAYETQPLFGLTIVDIPSATHLCTEPTDPIDADHVTIVKPSDQSSVSYVAFKQAFKDVSSPGSAVDNVRPKTPDRKQQIPNQKIPNSSPVPPIKNEARARSEASIQPGAIVGSVGQQGGITIGQLNINTVPAVDPRLPLISVATQNGLPLSDFQDLAVSANKMQHLRRQTITALNPNQISLENVAIRFQLPERVVFKTFTLEDRPPGVEITWHACRVSFSLVGDGAAATPTAGGGTKITTAAKEGASAALIGDGEKCTEAMDNPNQRPTELYQLRIAHLPSGTPIRIGFLTTNEDDDFTPLMPLSADLNEGLPYFGVGTFQFSFGGSTETRAILVPLEFDGSKRNIMSLPTEGRGRRLLMFRSHN